MKTNVMSSAKSHNGGFKSVKSQTDLSVNRNILFMKMLKSNSGNIEPYRIIWNTSIAITKVIRLDHS